MDTLGAEPTLHLFNPRRSILSSAYQGPAANVIDGRIVCSHIGAGSLIRGRVILADLLRAKQEIRSAYGPGVLAGRNVARNGDDRQVREPFDDLAAQRRGACGAWAAAPGRTGSTVSRE